MRNAKILAIVALIAVPVLFSSNMILARYLRDSVPPIQMAFWRWTFAALIALIFAWPVVTSIRQNLWAQRWRVIVLGGLGMAFCGTAVYQAAKTTTALNIGLVYAASPVFMGLLSRIMGIGIPHPVGWAGIGLAFIGVIFILTEGQPDILFHHWSPSSGLLWVIAATIAWALYSVILRQRSKDISEEVFLFAMCVVGVILLMPFLLLEGQGFVAETVGAREWLFLIFLGTVPSFLAYRGYAHVQKELGLLVAGSILFLTPLVNSLLANILLGEGISTFQVLGGTAILLGTWLIIQFPNREIIK